jgi:hypothetical protein
MAEALSTVRQLLAQLLGDRLLVGTATGGTGTTLYDTTQLVQPDDDWIGGWVYIYDGPLAGQERLISDSFQGSRCIVVSPTWTAGPSWTVPTTASKYEIHRAWPVLDAYNPMILMAFRSRRKRTLLAKTDETVTLVAGTYEYTIPTGFVAINEVWRADSAGLYVEEIPRRDLWVDRGGKKLVFDKAAALAAGYIIAGRKLRIIGQKYDTEPTSDSATFTINTTPIVWLAKAYIHAAEGNDASMNAALKASELDLVDDETPLWPGSLIVEEG